jgi:hypothetical protein
VRLTTLPGSSREGKDSGTSIGVPLSPCEDLDRCRNLGSANLFDTHHGIADYRFNVARSDLPDVLPTGALADR